MTKRDLIHELTLNGMKGISRLKKEILRNQLKLIRRKTGTSGQVATSYDALENNGSKGSDSVAYDSDSTDAAANEYDSDATDCSEMEIDGFIVYASANNGSKGSDSLAYDSDSTDATADEYDSDATDGSEIDGFIVYSKRCAWV